MTIKEILRLGEMGYTKEDIEDMEKWPELDPEPEFEKEAQKTEELEKSEAAKEPEQKSEPAADPTKDLLKFMAGEFEKLNKSIQDANILGSNIDTPKEKTAEDVLAELIAPPKKKGGK